MNQCEVSRLIILRFIIDFYNKNHYSPSIRDICQGTGIKSTSTVHKYLCELRQEGKLVYKEGKRRALVLEDDTDKAISSYSFKHETDDPSWIRKLPSGERFITKMNDSGMIDSLITAGDSLTVIRQDDAAVGNIVAAIYDDHLLIRILGIKNDSLYLMPDNECYIPVRKKDAIIVGKVVSMQREL